MYKLIVRLLDDWEIKGMINGYSMSKLVNFNNFSDVTGSGCKLLIQDEYNGLIKLNDIVKKIVLPELKEWEFGKQVSLWEDTNGLKGYIEYLDISKATCVESLCCLGFDRLGIFTEEGCKIRLNKNLKKIDDKAFFGAKIKSINIEETEDLRSIGNFSFGDTTGIKEVTLGEKLTHLGYEAFNGSDIERLTVKSNGLELDLSEFVGMDKLKSLDIRHCVLVGHSKYTIEKLNRIQSLEEILIDKCYKTMNLGLNNIKFV